MDDWKLKARVVVEIETESIMFVSFEFNLVIFVFIFSTFLTTQTHRSRNRVGNGVCGFCDCKINLCRVSQPLAQYLSAIQLCAISQQAEC